MYLVVITLAVLKVTGNINLSWLWIAGIASVDIILRLVSAWADSKSDIGKDWHPGMFD